FEKVRSLELTWARAERMPADKGLVSVATAPNGYVRAHVVIAFSRVDIPVTVAMIPRLDGGVLAFTIKARAQLDFDSRVLQLASAGLDAKFNTDPTVAGLLTLRISPMRLALPPVLTAVGDHLHMAGDLALTIADGATQTKGRVWSALDFRFTAGDAPRAAVDLGELELTCEPAPGVLKPCYSDLVDALRARAPDVHDTLTRTFTEILSSIF